MNCHYNMYYDYIKCQYEDRLTVYVPVWSVKRTIPEIVSLTITETIFGIGILFCTNDLALCRRSLVVVSGDWKTNKSYCPNKTNAIMLFINSCPNNMDFKCNEYTWRILLPLFKGRLIFEIGSDSEYQNPIKKGGYSKREEIAPESRHLWNVRYFHYRIIFLGSVSSHLKM